MSLTNSDKLIHGKSDLRRVVGLEVGDNNAEVFTQNEDGSISSSFIPNKFWLLSSRPLGKNFARLKGDLHYKYGVQFTERVEFQKMRSIWKNEDIYTVWNAEEAMMVKDGITFYRDLQPKDISLISIDIETTGIDPFAQDAKVLLISATYRNNTEIVKKMFAYDDYEHEGLMIDDLNAFIQETNPSLVIGHNMISFDIPYLAAIAAKNDTSLLWGRDGSSVEFNRYESKFRLDGTRDLLYKNIKIYGREVVDTYFLAVSFDISRSLESYGLKSIISQLKLESENRTFYDASQIRYNYKNPVEWEKIKAYCQDDADDAIKIWDMMGPLFFHLCPMIPKPMSEILLGASGSKINLLMVRAYLQDGHSIPKADVMQKFEGALSFAVPGIYKNCFKIDLAALYPSIMIEYEVYDDKKDPKGYLLELVKIFRAKRMEYKKLAAETGLSIWKEMDTTAKSVLNSFYGFMGAPGLNFNSLECAAYITKTGREILEYTIFWASGEKLDKFIEKEEEEVDEHG